MGRSAWIYGEGEIVANLTKEKILDMASEFLADAETFGEVNNPNWLAAVLFYNNGVNDFARVMIKEMEV